MCRATLDLIMEDHIMPETWTTVASAASALNLHPRTIERRIASGRLQSRRADDGQVQVLVDMPCPVEAPADPLETVRGIAQDQVNLATGSASALVRFAQDDSQRARQELELVRQEAQAIRRGSRWAWGAVATMAAMICVAVGWTTHRVTKADAEIHRLNDHARAIERAGQQILTERDSARIELASAKVAAADATGRLIAYKEHAETSAKAVAQANAASDNRPTTRPANIFERLATTFSNE